MPQVIFEEIGSVPGMPDIKTETAYFHGIPYPRVFHRAVHHIFTLKVKVPDGGDFGVVIRECIGAGLAAGGLSTLLASPGSAVPAFQAGFWGALALKLGDGISEFEWLGIDSREERGTWHPV